eukprot:1787075-Rhodomonas_salina.2
MRRSESHTDISEEDRVNLVIGERKLFGLALVVEGLALLLDALVALALDDLEELLVLLLRQPRFLLALVDLLLQRFDLRVGLIARLALAP